MLWPRMYRRQSPPKCRLLPVWAAVTLDVQELRVMFPGRTMDRNPINLGVTKVRATRTVAGDLPLGRSGPGTRALPPRGLMEASAGSLRAQVRDKLAIGAAAGAQRLMSVAHTTDVIHGRTATLGGPPSREIATRTSPGGTIPSPGGTIDGIRANGEMDEDGDLIPGRMVETGTLDITISRTITAVPGQMVETELLDTMIGKPEARAERGYTIRIYDEVMPGATTTATIGLEQRAGSGHPRDGIMRMISGKDGNLVTTTALMEAVEKGVPTAYGRPSEKLAVPTFSAEDTEDFGGSARSYLRQVSAWRQMTLLPESQQGLVLYQGLSGKAWIAAEELSVSRLGEESGIDYFLSWICARFLDLEVARIGKAFSDYFRRMRRRPGQSIREYNTEYDRLFGRLREVGCNLPQEAAAWMYLDRLQLEESQELNLLASVGNRYDLLRLQQAAILHDRGQRKPWEAANARNKKANYAHVTYHEEDSDLDEEGGDEGIPEEVAEAWVTYQSAKDRYRSQQRARGYNGEGGDKGTKAGAPDGEKDRGEGRDSGREAKLKMMKAKSFCSGCGRRGHWHKDDACPLNQGNGAATKGESRAQEVAMTTVLPAEIFALRHVLNTDLVGVADTACARTVAGTQWLQAYTDKIAELGQRPVLQREAEAYRFGTGKIHYSSFYVVVNFELGDYVLQVRTSIITGDIPLLLSRTVLGKMGMVFDVEGGSADFKKLGLYNYKLLNTPSGHPAIPIVPAKAVSAAPVLQVEDIRLQPKEQYMSVYAVAHSPHSTPRYTGIFHEKKLDPSVKDLLSQDCLQLDTFMTWWQQTPHDKDFWLETPDAWIRVHVVPRRAMFNPTTWRTTSTIQKDMLIATLGHTRMTESVCCSSGRWLEGTVDHWESCLRDEQTFPLLWVGRTVPPCQSQPRPVDHGAPCAQEEKPKAISAMRKTELLAEANRLGMTVHPSWTVVELKAVIREHMEANQEGDVARKMKKLNSLTLPELRAKANELHFAIPEKASKGLILKLVRESLNTPANTLMTIGRWRGCEYQEIPASYGNWAMEETRRSDNSHPDLIRYARWYEQHLKEKAAKTKVPDDEFDSTYKAMPCRNPGGFLGCGIDGDRAVVEELERKRECQGDDEADQLRAEGQERLHGGGPGRGRDEGDRGAGVEVGPAQGQGQEQPGVSQHETGTHHLEPKKENAHRAMCCGWVPEQEMITETEFVRGYHSQAVSYVTQHYEHNDHIRGERHQFDQAVHRGGCGKDFDLSDYTFANCEKLLANTLRNEANNLRSIHLDLGAEDQIYVTLGMYTHGGVHGVTRASKELDVAVRYLNHFGRHHLPDDAAWTSISITRDLGTELHRDGNNLKGTSNYCATFGQDSGGNLWLEENGLSEGQANGGHVLWKRDKSGAWIPGRTHSTNKAFLEFDPHLRHCSTPWIGQRWCLTYHSVRGIATCGNEIKKFLKNSGFPLPKVSKGPGGETMVKKRAGKSLRNTIMKNAGKISVLMATLMTAALAFSGSLGGDGPDYDPIVMLEIGGTEGTAEAVDLGKAVIEPISWPDYLNPDTQENMYHFVTAEAPVRSLVRDQLDEGGDVVIKGSRLEIYAELYKEYVQYKSLEEGKGMLLLGKAKKGHHLLGGHERAHQVCAVEEADGDKEKRTKYDGSGITFETGVPGHVSASLRRLHQNLGHPRNEDLCRHLRLAGCEPSIIKAVKGMKREACQATKGAQISRPSTLPRLLDFNMCVGIDIMYVHDSDDVKHAFLSIVDWATTYHVVARLEREAGPDVEKAVNDMWITPFGPPSTFSIDLDGKVQAGVARLCDWHGIKTKDVAAQAKWQGGITERQIGWFKGIWDRVNYELGITKDEVEVAGTLVCAAKNELRRRCGHSPVQWVFGRSPHLPLELRDPDGEEGVSWDLTPDSKFQRISAIRASARVAFHQAQGDDRLRRGLMQRARTAKQDYDIGDPVHYWNQPKDRRRPHWAGPAVVVGKQGSSYWVSRGGRCRLTAPEHLRSSGPEELGEYLAMKGVKKEVERLLQEDVDDPEVFDGEIPNDHLSDYEPSIFNEEPEHDAVMLDGDGDHHMEQPDPPDPATASTTPPAFRIKRKTRPVNEDKQADEVMMLKRAMTTRGQAKRQEKELKWSEIPESARENFKNAERTQWEEHISYDALEPLSLQESRKIRATVDASRILPCRWAYRDKNWAARQAWLSGGQDRGEEPEWKCKSRLVIGGHRDPDLGIENLSTDAPTLSRPGFSCLMQRLANGLREPDPWQASAGDIQCAFLTGGYISREEPLYLSQPTTGLPGLVPEQLVLIKKNIFGLATSPREWWQDLQKGIFQVHLEIDGKDYAFDQCPLDPCIFMLREMKDHRFIGEPIGYLGTHVDDILIVASGTTSEMIRKSLSSAFAIDRWDIGDFSYVGSEISCGGNEVTVTQTKYVESRLFLLEIPRHLSDEEPASFELRTDNQSLIGALSWLSAQTRPDLTCSVSLAQQLQKNPTIGDVRFTNQVSQRATMYKDRGLTFKPIEEEYFGILVYHDAAWANALEAEHDEPYFELTAEDREAGLQREGPFAEKARKAKRINSKVASQLGGLTMFADMRSLIGVPSNATIGDWRSKAGQRVCRSTFGAETQACVEGVEGGQYLRSFYETVKTGELVTVDKARSPLLCLSDCRSLYDHVHKEGVPRVPTDRRLAIDLAALRQNLRAEQWSTKLPLGWVPSGLQYGDILTKPSDPKDWWDMISTPLVVPIDIGEVTRASSYFGEKKTSVKHQDRMSSWINDCRLRTAV
ncbi:GIP [Symbiodinium sp. CCMP2592]|nr:GIP [Symbiodinium sp. CCMP2592]